MEFFDEKEKLFDIIFKMNLAQQQNKCNQCLETFDTHKSPLKMPKCSHNICSKCLQEIRAQKLNVIHCEFCHNSINDCLSIKFIPNSQLKQKITTKALRSPKKSKDQSSPNSSFKNLPGSQTLEDGDLLLIQEDYPQLQQENKKPSLGNISKQIVNHQFCKSHKKPLQIICVTDSKMICPHCAIFGQHKGHKFKTIAQLNKDFQSQYQILQMIKQQKYVNAKKHKKENSSESMQDVIDKKRQDLKLKTEKYFMELIQEIRGYEKYIIKEIQYNFERVTEKIEQIDERQDELEVQFCKWQSSCEDMLTKIQQSSDIIKKIQLLDGSLKEIDKGYKLVSQIQKKSKGQKNQIQKLIHSFSIVYDKKINVKDCFKVVKSDFIKENPNVCKDSSNSMMEKGSLPSMSKIQPSQFTDNSFICDFSKQQISVLLSPHQLGEMKTPIKNKVGMKKNTGITSTIRPGEFASPKKRITAPALVMSPNQKRLTRSKSNGDIFCSNPSYLLTQKKSNVKSRISSTVQPQDPVKVIQQFVTNTSKDVLDLSKCQLNDELAINLLGETRKQKRIKGLKLCQNSITDLGFEGIIQFLGSTTNLNLSSNLMTEQTLSLIIKNRDKLSPLRIINLFGNPINAKKSKTRIQTLKKMGIIVNL